MAADLERWREKARNISEARREAVKNLIDLHPIEFQALYSAACETRNIKMRRSLEKPN